MSSLPEIKLTVYTDYICPFCYVGHHRLKRLRDDYDLKINWCFLEIHPENSAAGEPVASMDYSSQHWLQLVRNLYRVAAEEHIPIAEPEFTTNSHDALVLAEAAKSLGRDTFYRLHEALFHACFVDRVNIGDRDELLSIASDNKIDEDFVRAAWNDHSHQHRLLQNFNSARRHQVQSVPTFVFGDRVLTGVVAEAVMRDAAQQMLSSV